MPAVIVRNISPETHRALKRRALAHGRSAEAEIREIVDEAVRPAGWLKIGSALKALGKRFGGVDLEIVREDGPYRYGREPPD